MALSEYEEAKLREMESHFRQSDPGLVNAFTTQPSPLFRFPGLGVRIIVLIVGLICLIAGTALDATTLGVAGFLLMLVAVSQIMRISLAARNLSPPN